MKIVIDRYEFEQEIKELFTTKYKNLLGEDIEINGIDGYGDVTIKSVDKKAEVTE